MKNIHVVKISEELANQFWRLSPNSNAFCNPHLLNKMPGDLIWYGAYKSEELLMIAPRHKSENGIINTLPHFYYIGPLWSKKWFELPIYRQYQTRLNIYNELIAQCLKDDGKCIFNFSPGMEDVRAFQWWNYHSENVLERFTCDISYTAIIRNLDFATEAMMLRSFRPDDKRKVIKKYLKGFESLKVVDLNDKIRFIDLYIATMDRTKGFVDRLSTTVLELLFDFAIYGNGNVVGLSDGNKVIGGQLLLGHNYFVNAVAQGVEQEYFQRGAATFLNFNCLNFARLQGYLCYDFNGANSPNRADDKHAFGAIPEAYFRVEI